MVSAFFLQYANIKQRDAVFGIPASHFIRNITLDIMAAYRIYIAHFSGMGTHVIG